MNTDRDIPIPPACRPTLERIQAVLDRVHPASTLAADPHPATCPACRDRVRAATRMLDLFAEPVTVRAGFADGVLAEVAHDRSARFRRKVTAIFALAASVAIVAWWSQPAEPRFVSVSEIVKPASPAAPPPLRVSAEFARASKAIRELTRTITEPATTAPKLVASLTESLLQTPMAPANYDLGAAGQSLADIPDAAKAGLEPVGNTAQKAFNRLLRDVTAMKPKT